MSEEITVEVAPLPRWAVWRGNDVPVWNHLPAEWRSRVIQLVDAFNQILPEKAPRLIYRDANEIPCDRMSKGLKARRGIAICLADELEHHDAAAMIDPFDVENHVLRRMTIQIRSDRTPGEDPLCHELMHALTGIDDAPEDLPFPYEDHSCGDTWASRGRSTGASFVGSMPKRSAGAKRSGPPETIRVDAQDASQPCPR